MDNDKYSSFEMIVLQINRQNIDVRVQLNFERRYNTHVIVKLCIDTRRVFFSPVYATTFVIFCYKSSAIIKIRYTCSQRGDEDVNKRGQLSANRNRRYVTGNRVIGNLSCNLVFCNDGGWHQKSK